VTLLAPTFVTREAEEGETTCCKQEGETLGQGGVVGSSMGTNHEKYKAGKRKVCKTEKQSLPQKKIASDRGGKTQDKPRENSHLVKDFGRD